MMWRMMMLRRRKNDDVEDDDVEEEDRSKDRDPQFAQACAIEMHMDMSQEPFYARIYKKNAVAPDMRRTFCASPNADGHVTKALL